jgi:hypothetical protein
MLFKKLIEIHDRQRSKYGPDLQSLHHIWAVGEQLSNPDYGHVKLGGIVNIRESHWVAVVIDVKAASILYGDSLGPDDSRVKKAVIWWIAVHTKQQFFHTHLLIGRQTDTASCGLFTMNMLTHFFLPEHPLISQADVRAERLRWFYRATTFNLDMVCSL